MIDFLLSLSAFEWTALLVSLALLLAARPVMQVIADKDMEERALFVRIATLRVLNLLIISTLLAGHGAESSEGTPWHTRALGVLLVVYIAYLSYHVTAYFIRKRFGKRREVEGKEILADTYNSRALSLLMALLLAVAVLITAVQILDFDSLLERGVLGFVGVMLALTQASWAPDIISGLIVLNSKFILEGDIVEVDEGGQRFIGYVFRTKMFHTEFLDLANNHRIMIRNARLRSFDLHNLTRFASARGLREQLLFKIDYAVPPGRVRAMFEDAFERASADAEVAYERQFAPDVSVMDTGDHAVTWALHYYTKDVRQMLKTRQQIMEHVLVASTAGGVGLSTPTLYSRVDDAPAPAGISAGTARPAALR